MADLQEALRHERLVAIQRESASVVRRTPMLSSASFSDRCGGSIVLKAECLQRTGSFKLRGALNKVRALSATADPVRGVVAGSAGNHGQSLAYAARHHAIPCEVFTPVDGAISKLEAVRGFGAVVHQEGHSVDDCVAAARRRAAAADLTFIHPFDDLEVIAGQASLGIELVEDVPDLAKVVVPVGGGGLAAGVAVAVKQARPEVEVIGVQAARCAPIAAALADLAAPPAISRTIADGIAVKRPGEITLPLLERWLDGVVTVDEEAIAAAMTLLLQRSKLVVEGAGAAAAAALIAAAVAPAANGSTVVILSGGNIDVGVLAMVAARSETNAGRRARFYTRIGDRPGQLARLLDVVAGSGANLIHVEHVRDGVHLGVAETGVVLTVEARGRAHLDAVRELLSAAGYEITSLV